MHTMLCRDNPAEAVRMYDGLKERIAELEQALERIATGYNWQSKIAEEALGRG